MFTRYFDLFICVYFINTYKQSKVASNKERATINASICSCRSWHAQRTCGAAGADASWGFQTLTLLIARQCARLASS